MSLNDIQKDVNEWTSQFEPQYWPPYQILARLMEETGEVSREINHLYGVKKKKLDEKNNSLGQEITDIMFTLVCLANSHEIDLQKEWEQMKIEKLYDRDKDRYDKKETNSKL